MCTHRLCVVLVLVKKTEVNKSPGLELDDGIFPAVVKRRTIPGMFVEAWRQRKDEGKVQERNKEFVRIMLVPFDGREPE